MRDLELIRGSPRICRIRCQRVRLRPYLPHAPGARMTVVTLTPSNIYIYIYYSLSELVRTHVILTPGACWGGAELQSVEQIRGDRQMNSKSRILYVFLQQKMLRPNYCAMFF